MFHQVQTQRLNLKALELAKEVKWPLFENLAGASNTALVSYLFGSSGVLFNSFLLIIKSWGKCYCEWTVGSISLLILRLLVF